MKKLGISLVALVITIVVLIVLTGAVIITGINVPEEAQLAVFYNNISAVQDAVTMKMATNTIKNANSSNLNNLKWVGIVKDYTEQDVEQGVMPPFTGGLGVAEISEEILINLKMDGNELSNYLVSCLGDVYHKGFEYKNKVYYNRMNMSHTQIIELSGPTDGSYYVKSGASEGVNSPQLIEGMKPVYYTDYYFNNEPTDLQKITSDSNIFVYDNWYNYIDKKWANAITSDGSYWVWIPRYAYKIESGHNIRTASAPQVDIKFLKGTTNEGYDGTVYSTEFPNVTNGVMDDYVVHAAFSYTDSKGNTSQLSGIWIAKYEMSAQEEINGVWTNVATCNYRTENQSEYIVNPQTDLLASEIGYAPMISTTEEEKGDVLVTASGNNELNNNLRAVSLPNVSSWRYISNGTAFQNALAYSKGIETTAVSHMIKNREWGAIAYLAQSKYGLDGECIFINNSSYHITGNAGETKDDSLKTGVQNLYYTPNGVKASTTGNIYGIYDMSGGAQEPVAAYVSNGTVIKSGALPLINSDNKYVDVYQGIVGLDKYEIRQLNLVLSEKYGDATEGWYQDYYNYPITSIIAFNRGQSSTGLGTAGLFGCGVCGDGIGWNSSWRIAIWPQY